MTRTGSMSVVALGLSSASLYTATVVLQRTIAFGPLSLWPVTLYVGVTVASFGLYLKLISLAASGRLSDRRSRVVAILCPVIITLALTVVPPSFSIDVFSYLAHGYQTRTGQNPYEQPVSGVTQTAYGRELAEFGWMPVHGVSPYGPLWSWLEMGVGTLDVTVKTQMRAIKVGVAAVSVLSALLIWMILRRVSPSDALLGTLTYLWNPVIIMEFAAEGHNDSLVIAAALCSLLLGVRERIGLSTFVLCIGALIKVHILILAPPLVAYWWYREDRHRLFLGLALGGSAGLALAALLYAPLWLGAATFDGLRAHGRPSVLASTPGALLWYLSRWIPEETLVRTLSFLITGGLIAYAAMASARARDESSLLKTSGRLAVAYLLLAPGYWPWYAAMPVALLALTPRGEFTWVIVAISLASRLAAPLDRLRINGLMEWPDQAVVTTIIALWTPAVVLLLRAAWRTHIGYRAMAIRIPGTQLGLSENMAGALLRRRR